MDSSHNHNVEQRNLIVEYIPSDFSYITYRNKQKLIYDVSVRINGHPGWEYEVMTERKPKGYISSS